MEAPVRRHLPPADGRDAWLEPLLTRRTTQKSAIFHPDCGSGTQVGLHLAGWFSSQPLYERIVREQPDLLE
jgi:hypothetical protein